MSTVEVHLNKLRTQPEEIALRRLGDLISERDRLLAFAEQFAFCPCCELFKEESVKGERVLVYRRGDFSASIKEREAVLYKVADSSKGELPPDESQADLV